MLFAWRFSRTFASRFNFANVVFFLPAKVDLQVAQASRGAGRHDGDALSTVLRPADARPPPDRLATSIPNAPSRPEPRRRSGAEDGSNPRPPAQQRPATDRSNVSHSRSAREP